MGCGIWSVLSVPLIASPGIIYDLPKALEVCKPILDNGALDTQFYFFPFSLRANISSLKLHSQSFLILGRYTFKKNYFLSFSKKYDFLSQIFAFLEPTVIHTL